LFFKLGESRRRSGAFSLRPQVVARWSDGGDLVDYVATVGAQFSFGRATTPTPAPTRQSVSETNVAPAADEHVMTHPTVTTPSCEAPADCEPAVPLVLVRVLFDTDSVAIRPEFEPQLERATEALRKHARVAIELQGHTDDRGTEAYNLALSERRAAVVREYLLARGVDSARVAFVGLGERQPAADNRTLEGRAANRRVEMRVTSNPDGVAVTE
jgi:outer membrane protein OmpA-like peptidoglycan-associated protein